MIPCNCPAGDWSGAGNEHEPWCSYEPAVSDEQMFRNFVEWTANIENLDGYDRKAHRANARNLLDVAKGGRLSNDVTFAVDDGFEV